MSTPFSCSILNWPQLPTLKLLDMKFELGQIIVWVQRAIIASIFAEVFVATVRLSFCRISSISLEASFSTKITSGLTWDTFCLIICTNDASWWISYSRSVIAIASSCTYPSEFASSKIRGFSTLLRIRLLPMSFLNTTPWTNLHFSWFWYSTVTIFTYLLISIESLRMADVGRTVFTTCVTH